MKQFVVLALFSIVTAGLTGCQNDNKVNGSTVDGGGDFPEFLAGTWKADKYNWQIRFEKDGRISAIVHNIWALPIDINEGGFFTEGPDEGTHALFIIGPCEAEYDANTCELHVKIVLDHFSIKLPQGSLEGRSEDFFEGPVSEDGTTWKAEWKNYGWLEGADPPDANLIEANPIPLVFTKVKATSSKPDS
jgi:hypothetical protein